MFSVYRIKEWPRVKEWLGDFYLWDEADQRIHEDIDRQAVQAGLPDESIRFFHEHHCFGDWYYTIEESEA